MNVALLKKISKHIGEEPLRFQMGSLVQTRLDSCSMFYESATIGIATTHEFAPCGTAACIAGWACFLSGKNADALGAPGAAKLLKITQKQGGRLFWVGGWPKRFREPYFAAKTPHERVPIAQKYIAFFIKRDKANKLRRKAS